MEYFTPLIEDIRVGYEFEVFLTSPKDKQGSWKMRSYEGKWVDDNVAFDYYLKNNKIRVPYLTKEQIEVEGYTFGKDNYGTLEFMKWETEIRYRYSTHKLHVFRTGQKPPEELYYGDCKDINTFRYICKLLGI